MNNNKLKKLTEFGSTFKKKKKKKKKNSFVVVFVVVYALVAVAVAVVIVASLSAVCLLFTNLTIGSPLKKNHAI